MEDLKKEKEEEGIEGGRERRKVRKGRRERRKERKKNKGGKSMGQAAYFFVCYFKGYVNGSVSIRTDEVDICLSGEEPAYENDVAVRDSVVERRVHVSIDDVDIGRQDVEA